MTHVLAPAALVLLGIGAIWSAVGWVADNYVQSVRPAVSRGILWSGVTVLVAGALLYIGPIVFVMLFARPA